MHSDSQLVVIDRLWGCNLIAEQVRGHTMAALLWSVATGLASEAVEFPC
jgi:hypothetical protein